MNAVTTTLPRHASSSLAFKAPPGSRACLPEPDEVTLSCPAPKTSLEEPQAATPVWTRVAQGAGLLCGLVGAGMAAPAVVHAQTAPLAQSFVIPQLDHDNGGIHVTAHIDATEPIVSPILSDEINIFEKAKAAGGDNVSVDVAVVRNYNPGGKAAVSLGCFAVTLAPAAGAMLWARKKGDSAFIRASVIGLGMAVSGYLGVSQGLAADGLKYGVSAIMDYSAQEPGWDGYRFYQVEPDQTPGFESRVLEAHPEITRPSVESASQFLAQNLSAHQDQLNVVVLSGHGLAYRHSAGFSFEDYQKMLKQAVEQSGRKIDVLVVESCLMGNTEFLAGTAPYANYAIVSEDVVAAGSLPTALAQAVASPDARSLTPQQLGQRLIEASHGNPRAVSTLALVDLGQMQQLDQNVGRLGQALTEQVQSGDRQAVLDALKATQLYPENEPMLGDQAKLLQFGDLNDFLRQLQSRFESSPTPQRAEILRLIEATRDSLNQSVVANLDSGSQHAMSIQLPAAHFQKLEDKLSQQAGLSLFRDSAAPEGWKQFVSVTSEVMKASQPATDNGR